MGVDDRVATLCACGDHAATTYCEDCALALCAECSNVRHGDSSSANVHHRCMPIDSLNMEELVDTHRTSFDHVDKLLHDDSGEDKKAYSIRGVQTALSHHQSSAFFTGLDREDPDQELSPTPPTKTPTTNSSDPSSYDMWGSWSVCAFRHRSGSENVTGSTGSSLNGIDEWQGFRSMSSDDSADTSTTLSLSADETLPLGSITRSLRSLSFASNADELDQPRATTAPQSDKRSLRPRSFSDYTTLGSGKLHDVWHDRVPEFQSLAAAPLQPQTSLVTTTTGLEMYRAMTTAVASRHVIIKSTTMESLDASCMQSVRAALNSFGAVASMRDEFVHDGVLFCTFYELKAAIGAVKMWSSTMPSRIASVETSAHFSIPYEPLDEINCATVLVHIHGPYLPSSASDIRKLCSRFGEVASVLEKEGHDGSSSQYIVEFNDVRDVVSVMSQLTGSVLPSGHILSMTRSHPPTLDLMKIQVFQECAGKISAARTAEKTPRFGNRPKSYSECTTVLTSPTSLSSSMSFLDGGVSRSAPRNEMDEYSLRADDASPPDSGPSSPFSQRLQPSGDVWRTRESARPRSSSAYATLTGGTSSSLLADAFQSSASQAARSSAHIPSYRSATQSPPLHSQQAFGSVASRLGPIRTGSDPGFRHSYASSNASTTGSVGRNDQGTGEFSLSIDKVMSGEDTRTTLMVRNIPNKYTQQMLLSEINCNHHGKYDFFYLPIDFKNKCNMGYAFINFIDAASIVPFYQEFDAQKWTNFNSEKVCAISYARLQGKQAMITRFQNSSLLDKHESYRPLVFHSSGPNRGQPETFPAPKPSTSHQHLNPHHFLGKPKMHQHHQSHSHLMMSASDEYLLAGRLYAQQQHHALLANAHAAAAAMLHNMPALGLPPNALASQYAQQRSFQYRGAYPAAQGFDRRQGHPYPSTLNPAHVPGSNVYSGAGFSSSSA